MRHDVSKACLLFVAACGLILPGQQRSLTASEDVYSSPSVEDLKIVVDQWIGHRNLADTPVVDAVAPFWQLSENASPNEKFEALIRTYYLADDDVRALVDSCHSFEYRPEVLQLQAPPTDQSVSEPWLSNNVRFFLARHLSLLMAYNEAAELFHQIDLNYIVDPAACLFFQSVCEHHLLMKELGLGSLDKLLNNTESVPTRYRKLAELMRDDLDSVKEKSLEEVARQMRDVERRLTLGRSDQGVQDVENKIVETLDELIKKMEQQQQQQQQAQAGGSSGSSAPEKGAQDSYLGGVQGEGLTDKKEIGKKDNWGDLPPKAREAAKNMLDQQFPSHYRQAVEQYLKKLAERPAP